MTGDVGLFWVDRGQLIKAAVLLVDVPVVTIDPPAGFEALSTALLERCAMLMVYARGLSRIEPRRIALRLVLKGPGVLSVGAYCHRAAVENTFRLDRIQA